MSAHIDREVPPSSRLQHILSVVLHARNSDISVTTRANTTNRAMSEFKNCPEVSMGRTHLTLSRVAEAALRSSMVSAQPLVIRSALTERDAMALIDEWELFVAQDSSSYQMADGRGKQSLSTMWSTPMRLEHDLQDTTTPNPVVTWLSSAQRGGVAARVWQLQQQVEEVAVSHGPILRRPAFATGLIPVGGGPAHFDEYDNTALVIAGKVFSLSHPVPWLGKMDNAMENTMRGSM
jgi:hypothetical protein